MTETACKPIDRKKEFARLFQSLCTSRSAYDVWSDFITATADAFSFGSDLDEERSAVRNKECEACMKRLGGDDIPAEMLSHLILALEENPEQDFLGEMYMRLGLGDQLHGQFFTPYNVCKAMSDMTLDVAKEKEIIEERGWTSVTDPSCGAGATLIASANMLLRSGINYQQDVVFAASDINRTTALMCYIQLSLLGCPGYVVVTDSLKHPITGSLLFPHEKPEQEFFYMPMWWSRTWAYRRVEKMRKAILQKNWRD